MFSFLLAAIAIFFLQDTSWLSSQKEKKLAVQYSIYDPSECPTDAKGKIYTQIGGSLFGFTKEQQDFKVILPPEKPLAEDKGCPSNPIIIDGLRGGMRIPIKNLPYMVNPAEEMKEKPRGIRHGAGFRPITYIWRKRGEDFFYKVEAHCEQTGKRILRTDKIV